MPRAPRIEFPGAVYHVMARGDGGKNIFDNDNDDDRKSFLNPTTAELESITPKDKDQGLTLFSHLR